MDGKISLDTTLDISDALKPKITFVATVPKDQWFSIGFGTSMTDTDMVLWQAKDAGICKDLYSSGHRVPGTAKDGTGLTETQDYTTTVKKEGDNYEFTSTRLLDTGDS